MLYACVLGRVGPMNLPYAATAEGYLLILPEGMLFVVQGALVPEDITECAITSLTLLVLAMRVPNQSLLA